jgi:putative tryptophan/tyrosine transport system substrate-binding protein
MPFDQLKRREFITLLGGAAAWPLAARGQQSVPVIGFLHPGSPEAFALRSAAFRKGLSEVGYVEGRNVAIEFRFANDQVDRLPELVADLIRHQVAVIAASSQDAAHAAKAATTTIPIVFRTGVDPVRAGLVASLNRPAGNVTGIADMNAELLPKRLALLHELLPKAARIGVLVNRTDSTFEAAVTEMQRAAAAIGRDIEVLTAATNSEIDAAFSTLVQKRAEALFVAPSSLFNSRRVQLVTLAAHHRVPTSYYNREFTDSGGLMSYGPNIADQYRHAGIYAGRVLKGEKPADLPVLQPTKFEFIINLQTAKTLGIEVPPTLLARADEVIE